MFEYRKVKSIADPPQENAKKIDELRIVCRPVVEYLRRNHTPYEKVIVDWTSAELFSGELGASYEIPD